MELGRLWVPGQFRTPQLPATNVRALFRRDVHFGTSPLSAENKTRARSLLIPRAARQRFVKSIVTEPLNHFVAVLASCILAETLACIFPRIRAVTLE